MSTIWMHNIQSWHNKLKQVAREAHPNVYDLIEQ